MDTALLAKYDECTYTKFTNPALIQKDLETLAGILTGITGDHSINEAEHKALLRWLQNVKLYEEKQPYKEIIELLRLSIKDDILTEDECKNLIWLCNLYTSKNTYFDDLTRGVQRLHGIVKGIAIDEKINAKEVAFLDAWLSDNEYLKQTWPYDELYNLTTKVLSDNIITDEEHHQLLSFCQAVSSISESPNKEVFSILSAGFFAIDPSILFQEKTFCITGISRRYKRKEIGEKIELLGGYMQNSVSSKLNYLIVCNEKNKCWAFTCYGRKVEEAMYQRRNGASLVIVHENDLYDAFEDFCGATNINM